MLRTNLTHIQSEQEHSELLNQYENVMVCCGRMGPMCVPVYETMEELESEYKHVKFVDMEFDAPVSNIIRRLPETSSFQGLPFVVYYKNGQVAKATSSIQSRDQITSTLDQHFNHKQS